MLTGKRARVYHWLLDRVRSGLAYDSEGDYSLTMGERFFYLQAARAVREGQVKVRSALALSHLAHILHYPNNFLPDAAIAFAFLGEAELRFPWGNVTVEQGDRVDWPAAETRLG